MIPRTDIDPQDVKKRSEYAIIQAGGRICDWLPIIEFTKARELSEVIDRALILNALLQLYFGAPSQIIAIWIEKESLSGALSAKERGLLQKTMDRLTEQERTDLYWYIEALWALAWVTGLVANIPFDQCAGNNLASLSPDLRVGEDGTKFRSRMKLRPYAELYATRDLYYRLHWWTRNAHLEQQKTGVVSLDIVMERRKALEWVLNCELDWDEVPLDT